MLSPKRLGLVLVILFIVPLSLWGGSAQPVAAQNTNCFVGLNAADCKLINDVKTVTLPNSFELGYNIRLKMVGIQRGTLVVTMTGAGPFDSSHVTGKTATSLVNGLNLSTEGTISYSFAGRSISNPLDLRFVDGTLFLYLPTKPGAKAQWYKLGLGDLLKSAKDDPDLSAINQILYPDSFVNGMASSMTILGKAAAKAGPIVEGKATRQITLSFDYGKIYDTQPDFMKEQFLQTFLAAVLSSSGGSKSFDFEKDPQLKAAAEQLVRSLKLNVSWLAEPKGKTLRGVGFSMSFTLSPRIGKMISPVLANAPLDFNFDMLFTYSKFGTMGKFEAPDDATDLLPLFQNSTSA